MRVISWFAGVGGFDLAFLRAGHEIVGACEIGKFQRKVYARRFGAPAWFPEDIEHVEASEIPAADVWVGGSPCQGFSIAGKREGLGDDRSGLLRRWLDLLGARRPEWFILENVPGILTANGGEDFGELLAALDDRGYVGAWRVLDAQHFGVAQRRRRVFLVAHAGDGARAASVLFEREGERRDLATSGEAWPGAAGRASRGAGVDVASSVTRSAGHHGHSSPRGDGSDNLVTSPILSPGHRSQRIDAEGAAGGQLIVASSVTRSAGHHGHSSPRGDGSDNLVATPIDLRNATRSAGSGAGSAGLGVGAVTDPSGSVTRAGLASFLVMGGRWTAAPDGSGETWGDDGPAPTLNANDVGDKRATALAFYPTSGLDQAVQHDVSPPLDGRIERRRKSAGDPDRGLL